MTTPHSIRLATGLCPLFLVLCLACGCASSRASKDGERPDVDPADAYTPLRVKYSVATPSDLADEDPIQIAVIDVDFSDGAARLACFPARYQPRSGLCQIIGERRECKSVAELVDAIDARVDRMPFGILFAYGMKPASQADVASRLPPAYSAFCVEFRSAMREEDIDFVTLLPDQVVFLN